MNLVSTKLSRRTFLGGAGAAAVSVAHASANSLIANHPLKAGVLIDGRGSLDALRTLIDTPAISLLAVVAASVSLGDQANRLLRGGPYAAATYAMPQRRGEASELPEVVLIFGRWHGHESRLRPWLLRRSSIYVDHPLLALKLAQEATNHLDPERTLAGLASPLDPAVEHVGQRLRSGIMGEVLDVAVVVRQGDNAATLEAIAALRHLSREKNLPRPRKVETANLQPAIYVTCRRGQLHIPLCSPGERAAMLPLRLQHFDAVARGDRAPSVSLPEMIALSEGL